MVRSSLGRYVRLVMKQKGLTLRDIEARSAGKITDGYVADILRGAANNPSAEKIKALGHGLGVDPHTIFEIICGPKEQNAANIRREEIPEVGPFLELMQEVAEQPDLVKIVEEAVLLLPEERPIVLKSLEAFNARKRKPHIHKSVSHRR
jgi:transcriptional regulator with XRE-family HTH domain